MATDPGPALVEALERFLREAREVVDQEPQGHALTPQLLATSMAVLPTAHEARVTANRAATVNNYLVPRFPRRQQPGHAAVTVAADARATDSQADDETAGLSGRPLDADALISTGVLAMLQARAPCDFRAVAEELASYLAGPPIGIWDYAVLDASFSIDEPIEVIDGWELISPSVDDLCQLLPLPATAGYQPDQPFNTRYYGGLAMLRRPLDDRPHP